MLVLYHIQVFHSFNTMFPSVYSFINQMICILQTGGTSSTKVNCVFFYTCSHHISHIGIIITTRIHYIVHELIIALVRIFIII